MNALEYNRDRAIETRLVSVAPKDTQDFIAAVRKFQRENALTIDGKFGPRTLSVARYLAPKKDIALDRDKIAKFVSQFEGEYWSVFRDGEFKGAAGKKHWAYNKVHIGLSFGYIQFTQDSGSLGKVLKEMAKMNPRKFREIFGYYSDDLLKVTNLKQFTPRINGRKRRVQPVGGHDLWEDYWVERFRKAGRDSQFQEAQRRVAMREYMEPAIKNCKKFGLKSERSLAAMFDRCVHAGAGGARKIFRQAKKNGNEFETLLNLYDQNKGARWARRRLLKIINTPELSNHSIL